METKRELRNTKYIDTGSGTLKHRGRVTPDHQKELGTETHFSTMNETGYRTIVYTKLVSELCTKKLTRMR